MRPSRALAVAATAVLAAGAPLRSTAGQQPSPAPPPASAQQAASPQRSAADSILEARTAEVAAQLRCPVCQGLSIQDSPSELSQQMRAVVKDQLSAGKTPEQVKAYFVSKYGEWILLEPKPTGFNILVYALPVLLVLGGLGVIAMAVRKWTRQVPGDAPTSAEHSSAGVE